MGRRVVAARSPAGTPEVESWGVQELLPPAWRTESGPAEGQFQLLHDEGRPRAWELRLLRADSALRWGLPEGIPYAEGEARPLAPAGVAEPSLQVWDVGGCSLQALGDDLVVHLDGGHVRGRYAVVAGPGSSWRLQRLDPASLRPMPERLLPMLAHAANYPEDEGEWAFEVKWDGARTLAFIDGDEVVLRSRTLADVTVQYPELKGLATALGHRQAVLDGEVVAFDEHGNPSFQQLQARFGVNRPQHAQRLALEVPVVYMAFDILYLDGHDVTSQPYETRRAMLEGLDLHGPHWRVPPVLFGHGRELLALPNIEGVVAKRLGSPYEAGARSRAWRKIKQQRRQELVIGGYTSGRGARRGRIGALLVGYFDPPANGEAAIFHYAGSVGTGFRDADLRRLDELLAPLRRDASPFAEEVDKPGAVFVEPRVVAEFEFTEWTKGGRLRHPSYKGLRYDKEPHEVVREGE